MTGRTNGLDLDGVTLSTGGAGCVDSAAAATAATTAEELVATELSAVDGSESDDFSVEDFCELRDFFLGLLGVSGVDVCVNQSR